MAYLRAEEANVAVVQTCPPGECRASMNLHLKLRLGSPTNASQRKERLNLPRRRPNLLAVLKENGRGDRVARDL